MTKIGLKIMLFFIFSVTAFSTDVIIYQKLDSQNTRYNEYIELLETSLEKTKSLYGNYELKQSNAFSNELRAIAETQKGVTQNIVWYGGSSPELEKKLLPIYIPLGKGIMGYRILLIRKENQLNFSKVKTLDDLRNYKEIHGFDWGDVEILKYNKIPLELGNDYERLFIMLNLKRGDFFSRGINEGFNELNDRKDKFPDLCVEETLLLYYPWPFIFYVSPKYPKIAERIEKGLRIMLKDGTFDNIFLKYNSEFINRAKFKERRIIKLTNPFVSQKFDFNDKTLWFDPFK